MSVFRIEKTSNYTVMANYHFKEKEMSLKAKGLLSLMLSLPDNWDYSIAGLVSICKENETAIKSTIKELQEFGYLQVIKNMPTVENSGRISYEYIVYERPIQSIQEGKKQGVENLGVEIQGVENPPQVNTNELNTKEVNNITNINISNMQKSETPFDEKLNKNEEPKKKTKTQKQINAMKINKILEVFVRDNRIDEDVEKELWNYLSVRKLKGLVPEQWQQLLNEFYIAFKDKSIELQKQQVHKATLRSWTQLTYADNFEGKPKVTYGNKPSFDNTADHNIPKGVASMTPEERKAYEENELAKDENGNYIKF